MEEYDAALRQAYTDYRRELSEAEQKLRPTDGLLGFGKSLKDDACHTRFDDRLAQAVDQLRAAQPGLEAAAQAVRLMLLREGDGDWPLSAQWMLCAAERHSLPLIPFLSAEDAAALGKAYAKRYRPWDRLPVQKQVLQALNARAKG